MLCAVVHPGWSGREHPKHLQPDSAGHRQPVHHVARQQGHQAAAARSEQTLWKMYFFF